ncbi:MAG TPA: HAMP domain-containing sensor histidine kinase [Gaiellaceae bacterium]|nr:HAMP domain-containing sensor histidine kinase [Gaiellaceae bacterium]
MTLRTRLALASAAAVAIAVAVVSVIAYLMVRNELQNEVDGALARRAAQITSNSVTVAELFQQREFPSTPRPPLGGAAGYAQLVDSSGQKLPQGDETLPISSYTLAVSRGRETKPRYEDVTVNGIHARLMTVPFSPGIALQVARPLAEMDDVLDRLRLIILLVAVGGTAIAAALGLAVSRASLAPVRRLTETAEHITATHDLSRRVEAERKDEVGRLARSFNTMLGALEDSLHAQRQLVADASHELRTPLTSLRTNVELLARGTLSDEERERAMADVSAQIEELTALVADVVEMARDGEPRREVEDVRLDELVADAVARARLHSPQVAFHEELEESLVTGVPERLHRAIANVLDNAAKWSPPGGQVDVAVRDGEVSVRDHGQGIDPADLPYVFERFYRSAEARNRPGSGLGLAIVRQVAEAHGGTVSAERMNGGGTIVRIRIPTKD